MFVEECVIRSAAKAWTRSPEVFLGKRFYKFPGLHRRYNRFIDSVSHINLYFSGCLEAAEALGTKQLGE